MLLVNLIIFYTLFSTLRCLNAVTGIMMFNIAGEFNKVSAATKDNQAICRQVLVGLLTAVQWTQDLWVLGGYNCKRFVGESVSQYCIFEFHQMVVCFSELRAL